MQFTPIAVDQTTAITDLLLALAVFFFMLQLRRVKTPRQWKLSMWIWTFAILVASAALGKKIWDSFAAAAIEHTLKILDGADPAQFQRYADLLEKNTLYQGWINAAAARDAALAAKQSAWLAKKHP